MQRLNRIVILLALFITSCGQGGKPRTQESNNLFLNPNNQQVEENLSSSLLGLWESEMYDRDGFTYKIRWEVTDLNTTLAKKCTDAKGRSWYAQVTLPYQADIVVQADLVDPYDIPVVQEGQVSDITLMTENKACRVALNPQTASTQSLVASDTTDFDLVNDNFETGEMTLETNGQPAQVQLLKIQNR